MIVHKAICQWCDWTHETPWKAGTGWQLTGVDEERYLTRMLTAHLVAKHSH